MAVIARTNVVSTRTVRFTRPGRLAKRGVVIMGRGRWQGTRSGRLSRNVNAPTGPALHGVGAENVIDQP